ncbi:MAG: hypothetical protein MUC68_18515, partial [Burkholderiaceae bacterium]|nr:hypothetical protein [Burkholderiaceae bacterium]
MRPTKSRRRQGERSRSTRSIDRTHRHAATPIGGPMLTLGALAIALLAGCGQADAPGAATAAPAPVTSSADAATVTSATSTTQATPATPAAPVATSPAPTGSDAATSANPPTANAAGGDPFAGIDPSQHDVLRAIARIDPAAAKGASRPTPSTAAPSREAAGAGGVTGTDSARPAARPTPAAAPAPTAAAPLANGA